MNTTETASVLTLYEAAEFLRVSERTLWQLAREQQVPHFELAGSIGSFQPSYWHGQHQKKERFEMEFVMQSGGVPVGSYRAKFVGAAVHGERGEIRPWALAQIRGARRRARWG